MRFVAEKTSIPVPTVHYAFRHKDKAYLVMQRISGDVLGNVWPNLDHDDKTRILAQLRRLVNEMRNIKPDKGTRISNVDGGPLYDARLPGSSCYLGPFDTVEQFHLHLRTNVESVPQDFVEVAGLIRSHKQDWPLCLTHGDLSSLNILVRDGQIVGLIDWESSGWYPSYWEYTTAYNVNPQNEFWRTYVEAFLDTFPEELEMEMIRRRYFGEI